MRCPDDFTLSQYADGELPENETRKLAAHFEGCAGCRNRAQAFEAENRLLSESLQGIEWWMPEQETVQRKMPGFARVSVMAAVLFGITFMVRTGFDFILNLKLPSNLDWLHPLRLSGQLNLIANGFFYFLEKGRDIMTGFVNEVGTAVLGVFIFGVLITLIRRTRRMASLVCLTSMMLVFVMPGHAIEIRKADKDVSSISVASDEIIDDSLVVFADSVDVRGVVTGDLITFARRINVPGAVQGNIVTFGQNVEITGKVDGDIMGFAQTIRANGDIGKNLWAFGQNITIDPSSKLEQNATVFGANVNVDGEVGRDLWAFAAFLDVGGSIGRDLNLRGEKLTVRDPSIIGRNLNVRVKSEDNVQILPGATIQGATNIELQTEHARPNKYLTIGFYFKQILRIAGAFLMGLLLFWLIPGIKDTPLSNGVGLLTSGGIGFLTLVATPVAILIMAITVLGLPVAFTTLLFYLLALYLSKIVIGRYIGKVLLRSDKGTMASTALELLLGIFIVIVAVNLPFIGGILNILLIIIGLGALLISAYRTYRKSRERVSEATP
jgi:cytoskeletal protein CcmA (bactofilin family)